MKILPLSEMIEYLRDVYYHNRMDGYYDPRICGLDLVAKIYGIELQKLTDKVYKP